MVALLAGITPEQYLEWERKAETKSEYVNGRINAMAGVTRQHDTIAINIVSELRFQLKGRPCEAHTSDLRVQVEATGKYAYSDASVVCGQARFSDSHKDNLLNPVVLVEVLSPGTEAYDRGGKFAHYRRIPSLQEYIMVAQNQALVEHYARHGEQWTLTEYRGLEAILELPSIQCRIPLMEIYDKVEFPPQPVPESERIQEP